MGMRGPPDHYLLVVTNPPNPPRTRVHTRRKSAEEDLARLWREAGCPDSMRGDIFDLDSLCREKEKENVVCHINDIDDGFTMMTELKTFASWLKELPGLKVVVAKRYLEPGSISISMYGRDLGDKTREDIHNLELRLRGAFPDEKFYFSIQESFLPYGLSGYGFGKGYERIELGCSECLISRG